jgi:hypothetical protein
MTEVLDALLASVERRGGEWGRAFEQENDPLRKAYAEGAGMVCGYIADEIRALRHEVFKAQAQWLVDVEGEKPAK